MSISQEIKIKYFETKLNEDTVELASGFDGVCVFVNDTVNAPVIDRLCEMGVGLVALRCAGFNNVDMKHAAGRVRVMRVPAYSPYAVAEHTMAMLLTSIRRIHKAYIRTRDFNFSLAGMTGFDLHGKTVGVIGTGRIGRGFIDICRGFGMKVLAYDKFPAKDLDNGDTIRYVELDELFRDSDVISLHCPLTEDTYHIIGEETIEKCKKGVVIAHDNRRFSISFCLETAGVLAANGIQTYIFDSLRPTPELSFAVRELSAQKNAVGFIFGGIEKDQLFDYVRRKGIFPRKTFSIGHAVSIRGDY